MRRQLTRPRCAAFLPSPRLRLLHAIPPPRRVHSVVTPMVLFAPEVVHASRHTVPLRACGGASRCRPARCQVIRLSSERYNMKEGEPTASTRSSPCVEMTPIETGTRDE